VGLLNGYIVAFDPSLNNFGLSVLKLTEQRNNKHKIEVIECSYIPNKHFDSSQYGLKLLHIERRLYQIRDIYRPAVVLREEMANSPSHEEIKKLGAVQSLIDKVFYGYNIIGYSPTKIKKTVCGDGKGDKLAIQNALRQYVGEMCWQNDDMSDSLAVAYTYLIDNGIVQQKIAPPE
jgi:Holliday junction resolvasome RuvABC endonuclease subunit